MHIMWAKYGQYKTCPQKKLNLLLCNSNTILS